MDKPNSVGFFPRLAAFTLDMLPVMGYILLLFLVGMSFIWLLPGVGMGALPNNPFLYDCIAFLTTVLPVILYFAFQEASTHQASWGKRRLGLQVVTSKGSPLSFWRSLLRSVIKFIPWQIAHTCLFHIPGWPFSVEYLPVGVQAGLFVVYLLLAVTLISLLLKPHRTPYDWIAGTYVIKGTLPAHDSTDHP